MSNSNPPHRGERGQTALMIALLAPLLVLLVGVVVDGGRMLLAKRQAQVVADSAALAAVNWVDEVKFRESFDNDGQQILRLHGDGETAAWQVARHNEQGPIRLIALSSDDEGLRATAVARAYIPFYFLPIIDWRGVNVGAVAEARLIPGITEADQ